MDSASSSAAVAVGSISGLDPEIVALFATPLIFFDIPDAPSLNVELRRVISWREKGQASMLHSNQGGWQSSPDMDRWGGAPAIKLLAIGRNIANRVTRVRRNGQEHALSPGHPVVPWKGGMWANVNRSGHANELHWHRGTYWAGVYYVDDGGIDADASLGGELEFVDPRGPVPTMFPPELDVALSGGLSPKHRVSPKAGRLVMFPAWLMHQVRP